MNIRLALPIVLLAFIVACKKPSTQRPTSSENKPSSVEYTEKKSGNQSNTEIIPDKEVPIVVPQEEAIVEVVQEEAPYKPDLYEGEIEEIFTLAQKDKKIILIDFWAKWCGPCKKMDLETYSDPELKEFIANKYHFYRIDVDSFDGLELAQKYKINEFPMLIVLDGQKRLIKKVKGYMPASYLRKEINNF